MTALTRQEIVQHLRVSSDPVISQAADLIEHDGRALAATSQSEYERELVARLQRITEERDRFAGLLGEAVAVVETFAGYAEMVAKHHPGWDHDEFMFELPATYSIKMQRFRAARALLVKLRSLDANPQETS